MVAHTSAMPVPVRQVRKIRKHLSAFDKENALTDFDVFSVRLSEFRFEIQKKGTFKKTWVDGTSGILRNSLVVYVERRTTPGSGSQFHRYIDKCIPLEDLDVIEPDGNSVIQLTYKMIKSGGRKSQAGVGKHKLRFPNDNQATEFMETIVKLRGLGMRNQVPKVCERTHVMKKLEKYADNCYESLDILRIQHIDGILRLRFLQTKRDTFMRIATCANAKKTQFLSADFHRRMQELESKEKSALEEKRIQRRHHDFRVGAVLLDQFYRKTLATFFARLESYHLFLRQAPLERRCRNFLIDAVEVSQRLYAHNICGTRGLAMMHMLDGLHRKRISDTLIQLKNKSREAKLREEMTYKQLRMYSVWLQRKEVMAGASAIRRWHRSAHIAQVQYEAISKYCRYRVQRDTGGAIQLWYRWSRRLCDIDKEGSLKLLNVIETAETNLKAHAMMKLHAFAQENVIAEGVQILQNLSMVNDVLEQTFDAGPLERACCILATAVQRRHTTLISRGLAKLAENIERRNVWDNQITTATASLQRILDQIVLRHFLSISHRAAQTILKRTIPTKKLMFATKKSAAHDIGCILRCILRRVVLTPPFRDMKPIKEVVTILNVHESLKDRTGSGGEQYISAKKHARKMCEFGLLALTRVLKVVEGEELFFGWDTLKLRLCRSRRGLPIRWDADYVRLHTSPFMDSGPHDALNPLTKATCRIKWNTLIRIAEDEAKRGPSAPGRKIYSSRNQQNMTGVPRRHDILGFTPVLTGTARRHLSPLHRVGTNRRKYDVIMNYLRADVEANAEFSNESVYENSSTVASSEISSLLRDFDSPIFPTTLPISSTRRLSPVNGGRLLRRRSPPLDKPPSTTSVISGSFLSDLPSKGSHRRSRSPVSTLTALISDASSGPRRPRGPVMQSQLGEWPKASLSSKERTIYYD